MKLVSSRLLVAGIFLQSLWLAPVAVRADCVIPTVTCYVTMTGTSGTSANVAVPSSTVSTGAMDVRIFGNSSSPINTEFQPGDGVSTSNGTLLNIAGFNYFYTGTNYVRPRTADALGTENQTGKVLVAMDGTTNTYAAFGVSSNATAGVFYEITGSSTKTVKIRHCEVSGAATSGSIDTITAEVLSTADSGGTGTAQGLGAFDSNNATATATAKTYTVAPTLGTVQSAAWYGEVYLGSSGTPSQPTQVISMDWPATNNSEAPTLRGTSQQFVVTSGTAITGGAYWTRCTITEQ